MTDLIKSSSDSFYFLKNDHSENGIFCFYIEDTYPLYYANEQFCLALGYNNANELLVSCKARLQNLLLDNDYNNLINNIPFILQNEELKLSLNFATKSGESKQYLCEFSLIPIADGKFAILCFNKNNDIKDETSKYYQNELKKLQIENSNWQKITDSLPIGILWLSMNNTHDIFYYNRYFLKLTEYSAEEIVTLFDSKLKNIIYESDMAFMGDELDKQKNSHEVPTEIEIRIKNKTKNYIWVRCVFQVVKSNIDEISLHLSLADINRRKTIEDELKISNERYRIALAHTNNIIFDYDILTKTISNINNFNKNFTHKETVTNNALLNSNLIHEDYISAYNKIFSDIHNGKKTSTCIIKLNQTASKKVLWRKITLNTVMNNDNTAIKAIGLYEDISYQKEIELKNKREEFYRIAMISNTFLSYEVNLTKSTVKCGVNKINQLVTFETAYDKVFNNICNNLIHSSYIKKFSDSFSAQAIKKSFDSKNVDIYCEVIIHIDDAQKWVSTEAHIFADHDSDDLMVLLFFKDIDERKRNEEMLKYQAEHDLLSGFFNKEYTEKYIIDSIDSCEDGDYYALFLLDLDYFKNLNDSFGHIYGDGVLKNIAKELKLRFRKSDILGRIGGDEFMMFIKGFTSEKHINAKAKELLFLFEEYNLSVNEKQKLTASIGIAFNSTAKLSFKELYHNADNALYLAKAKGRNTFELFKD